MKFKDFMGTTKGKVIVIGGAAVVAVGIGLAVLLQGGGYRSITVEAMTGTVDVAGSRNNGAAYVGEQLEDGDDVTVRDASDLTMCMDGDKYVYADANTHFALSADQSKDASRIKILLDEGSELNELQNALGANDSYEVDTPNSTMAVRGTKFRVTVYTGDDGYKYTLLEVYEGTVFVRLKTEDGKYNGVERSFTVGESGLIRGNVTISEFVTVNKAELADISATEEEVLLLHYDSLPEESVPRLIELIRNGEIRAAGEAASDEADEADEADETAEDASDKEDKKDAATTSADDTDDAGQDGGDDATAASDGNADEGSEATSNTNTNSATANKTQTAKPAHVHTAGDWQVQTAATCQAEGVRVQVCTGCGEVMNQETIAKTGHVAGDWVALGYPTCGVKGARAKYCTMCGALLQSEDIPALSHNWGSWGDDGTRQCSNCGAVESGGPVANQGSVVSTGSHESSSESSSSGGSTQTACVHAWTGPLQPPGSTTSMWICSKCQAVYYGANHP